jgi:hypothetical protein
MRSIKHKKHSLLPKHHPKAEQQKQSSVPCTIKWKHVKNNTGVVHAWNKVLRPPTKKTEKYKQTDISNYFRTHRSTTGSKVGAQSY